MKLASGLRRPFQLWDREQIPGVDPIPDTKRGYKRGGLLTSSYVSGVFGSGRIAFWRFRRYGCVRLQAPHTDTSSVYRTRSCSRGIMCPANRLMDLSRLYGEIGQVLMLRGEARSQTRVQARGLLTSSRMCAFSWLPVHQPPEPVLPEDRDMSSGCRRYFHTGTDVLEWGRNDSLFSRFIGSRIYRCKPRGS